ncbi:MAG: serine hydrolase [Flavobacteriaceae bacterium]|nr:serine hydrolase [Flavobacteriaceae bacterium]
MRPIKSPFIKTLIFLFILALVITSQLYITGNQYIIRGFANTYMKGRTTAGIYDYTDFDNRIILSGQAQAWDLHSNYNQIPLTDSLRFNLEKYKSDAFIIIHDGKLFYEEYWNGRTAVDVSNSFSMAKTYVAFLLFKAIENGDIQSLEQPITDFLPQFKNDTFGAKCSVGDLAAMTSGFDWKENYYLPLNPTAKAYFGTKINDQMLNRKFISEPGKHFEYLSGNTQLLGMVIEKATGHNLSYLLSEQLWKPLGMEHNALWSLDGSGETEKAYCCVNATALDFAKIGSLFLQKGNWKGRQIIDTVHIDKMTFPNTAAFESTEIPVYGYSVWMDYSQSPAFYAFLGHLGQRTIIVPEHHLVILRLGHKKDERILGKRPLEKTATDAYYMVDEVVKMLDKNLEIK